MLHHDLPEPTDLQRVTNLAATQISIYIPLLPLRFPIGSGLQTSKAFTVQSIPVPLVLVLVELIALLPRAWSLNIHMLLETTPEG